MLFSLKIILKIALFLVLMIGILLLALAGGLGETSASIILAAILVVVFVSSVVIIALPRKVPISQSETVNSVITVPAPFTTRKLFSIYAAISLIISLILPGSLFLNVRGGALLFQMLMGVILDLPATIMMGMGIKYPSWSVGFISQFLWIFILLISSTYLVKWLRRLL